MPRLTRISSSTGPTLVTAGRRLKAASTSAIKITTPAVLPGDTIPSARTVLRGAGLRLPADSAIGRASVSGHHSRGAVTLYSMIRQ